ncbi:unnamed protein product [Amoebophrya sp. A120]|nr:unnamed protein product [Amoebophrya sp. A120]|eukprot:GSA120T00018051001.1
MAKSDMIASGSDLVEEPAERVDDKKVVIATIMREEHVDVSTGFGRVAENGDADEEDQESHAHRNYNADKKNENQPPKKMKSKQPWNSDEGRQKYAAFVQGFVEKMRAVKLTEVQPLQSQSIEVMLKMEQRLQDSSQKKTWQHDKRGKHGGQIESIAACVLDQLRPTARTLLRPEDALEVVELGAGKGLLGQVVAELAELPLTVVDKREVRNGFFHVPDVLTPPQNTQEVVFCDPVAEDAGGCGGASPAPERRGSKTGISARVMSQIRYDQMNQEQSLRTSGEQPSPSASTSSSLANKPSATTTSLAPRRGNSSGTLEESSTAQNVRAHADSPAARNRRADGARSVEGTIIHHVTADISEWDPIAGTFGSSNLASFATTTPRAGAGVPKEAGALLEQAQGPLVYGEEQQPQPAKVVLLAKHLCSNASDVAVRHCAKLLQHDRLSLFACAPCCHHKGLTYENYVGREWWEQVLQASEREFALCKQLIYLSKVPTLHQQTCRNWKLRHLFPNVVELKRLGILARRVVEEGRLAFLRWQTKASKSRGQIGCNSTSPEASGGGFCEEKGRSIDIKVLQYCLESVSPDNLLLLVSASAEDLSEKSEAAKNEEVVVNCNQETAEAHQNFAAFPPYTETEEGYLVKKQEEEKHGAARKEELLTTAASGRGPPHNSSSRNREAPPRTSRERDGVLLTLVAEATAASQPQKLCEFVLENRGKHFPSVLGVHVCDLPVSTDPQNTKSSRGVQGTDHRQILIASTNVLQTCAEIRNCPIIGPLVDRVFPHNHTLPLLSDEEVRMSSATSFRNWLLSEVCTQLMIPATKNALSGPPQDEQVKIKLKCSVQPRRLLPEVLDLVAELQQADTSFRDAVELSPGSDSYTHTLCVAAWRGMDCETQVGLSIFSRAAFDAGMFSPDVRTTRKEHRSWRYRLLELQRRAGSNRGHPLQSALVRRKNHEDVRNYYPEPDHYVNNLGASNELECQEHDEQHLATLTSRSTSSMDENNSILFVGDLDQFEELRQHVQEGATVTEDINSSEQAAISPTSTKNKARSKNYADDQQRIRWSSFLHCDGENEKELQEALSVDQLKLVLVDAGRRKSTKAQAELLIRVKKNLPAGGASSSQTPVLGRMFATDVSKFDVRRHLKSWCQQVSAQLQEKTACARLEILHLLTDAKLERTVLMVG